MFNRNKKLIVCATSVFLAVAILGLFMGTAWAAPTTPAATPGGKGTIVSGITNIAMTAGGTILMLHAILYAIQLFLNGLLALSATMLDLAFNWNVLLVPGSIDIVPLVWGYMRDIANSLFILIILWIAFTIIFNFEGPGTQRLLVRVILIALLINFSLAMVSGIFGLANAFALPFRNAMNNGDVSSFIAGESKIHNVVTKIDIKDLKMIEEASKKADQEATAAEGQKSSTFSPQEFLGYLGKPKEAHAVGPAVSLLTRLGLGALTSSAVVQNAARAGPWLKSVWGRIPAWAKVTGGVLLSGGIAVGDYQNVVNLALQDFFLLLLVFAILSVSIILTLRIVMMVFLSMLAPAAFLMYALPGKLGEKYWNMWLDNVLRWAFLAPAFYFLFYTSLLILQQLNDNPFKGVAAFSENMIALINVITFLVFLYASIFIARKMGGALADTSINWGKKFGKFALKNTVAPLATRGLTRLVKPGGMVSRGLTKMAAAPGVRWIGGAYPQRAATRFIGQQQKKIDEQEKSVAAFSKEQLMADYSASFTPERKVAIMRRVAKEGWMDDFQKRYRTEGVQRGLDLATRYGGQGPILEELPHLATKENVFGASSDPDAINTVVKRIKEKAKLRKDTYREPVTGVITPAGKDIMRSIVLNTSISELGDIGRKNADLQKALQDFIDDPVNMADLKYDPTAPDNKKRMSEARYQQIGEYLAGTLAKGKKGTGGPSVGWNKPVHW